MISLIIRTVILYAIVTLAIRLMGKRQIADMQPNELVVTLLISEIAAIPLQDMDQPVLSGFITISMLVIIEIIISILAMKSFFIRKMMSGKSIIIIKNGTVDMRAMKSVRMTVLDLVELLRTQDVFDISEVAFAVLEVNGQLSVVLKSQAKTVTLKDLNIKGKKEMLPLPVVSDGKIVKESLQALNLKPAQLDKILKVEKLTPADIFLMTLDQKGTKRIVRKDENI